MHQADHHVQHHQHAKVHQVHAQQTRRRQQHGHEHQQQHRNVEKAAQHQEQQVHQQQELHLVQLPGRHPGRHGLGHGLGGEGVVEHEGAGQHQGDDGAGAGRFQHHGPEAAPAERPVHHRCQQQRVQRRHRRRLRRGEDARVDAAQQHCRHGQRQRTAVEDAGPFAPRHRRGARHLAAPGDDPHHAHHQRGHEKARNHPAQEQRPDRSPGHQGVDHHRNAGRDDGPQGRAGHHHRAGKAAWVLRVLEHLADGHQPRAGSVGDGAAAHAGEDDADQDVDVRQPAAQAPDQDAAEVENARAHGAGIHEVGGEDEHRHGQ